MRRGGVLLLCLLFLQGCFLPIPIRVATWAVNGISYATTQKSLTDHAVSEVAEKDCATWRVLKGESVCRDIEEAPVVLADADVDADTKAPDAVEAEDIGTVAVAEAVTSEPVDTDSSAADGGMVVDDAVLPSPNIMLAAASEADVTVNQLADFETAAGSPDMAVSVAVLQEEPAQAAVSGTPIRPVGVSHAGAPVEKRPHRNAIDVTPDLVAQILMDFAVPPRKPGHAAEPALVPAVVASETVYERESAAPGLYYVIGSFGNLKNAKAAQIRHQDLGSSIVSAELDGRSLYRVTVGPFAKSDLRATRRMLTRAGIFDAWAIRLEASDWVVAKAPILPRDVAELQR
ncbi:MAG: SPOR domain-containing protein [Rhodospirillales bacterium]|nr:SPOR domain-containing protein [Rhodospirillales bacterium]